MKNKLILGFLIFFGSYVILVNASEKSKYNISKIEEVNWNDPDHGKVEEKKEIKKIEPLDIEPQKKNYDLFLQQEAGKKDLQVEENKEKIIKAIPIIREKIQVLPNARNEKSFIISQNENFEIKSNPREIKLLNKISSSNKKNNELKLKALISQYSNEINGIQYNSKKENIIIANLKDNSKNENFITQKNEKSTDRFLLKEKIAIAGANPRDINIQEIKIEPIITTEQIEIKIEDLDKAGINIEQKSKNYQEIAKNQMTIKQYNAKLINPPIPEKKKNRFQGQITPPNISQKVYNNNNRHLQAIMFDYDLEKQAFDNLNKSNGDEIAMSIVRKLANPDIKDENGNTLLMHAVFDNNIKLVNSLLAENANPNLKNDNGISPMHLAASYGNYDALYPMVFAGGNPNLQDLNGNTPTMYAAGVSDIKSINLLLSYGGSLDVINNNGMNVLAFAKMNENREILDTIVDKIYIASKEKISHTAFNLND